MPPRYTARRDQGKPRYSVWDNDKDGIAITEGRECTGFSFSEALDMARKLNDENPGPKQGRPTLIEQPAARQQRPSADAVIAKLPDPIRWAPSSG
jgi:hypothetical protein